MTSRTIRAIGIACSVALGSFSAIVRAADVSPPVILQWFESSWKTMERRTPDVFMAGYGAVWTPPPGRALYDDQGGGIGYKSREWIAHPRATETLTVPTALAWNPSVTGTKVEDTCLLHQEGLEIITTSPGWPVREVSAQGRTLLVADHLVLPES